MITKNLLILSALLLLMTQAGFAQSSPTQTYQNYLSAKEKLGEFKAVTQYFVKEKADLVKTMSRSEKAEIRALTKQFEVSDVKVLQETVTGSKALLKATGRMNDVTGVPVTAKGNVELSKESGRWRIQQINWSDH